MNEKFMQYIEAWCEEYKIVDRCVEGFWKHFESYVSEHSNEFSETFQKEPEEVTIALDKIYLCLNYYVDYGKPTIQIDFHILLKDEQIGWYREIYSTDGEFMDDCFYIK